MPKVGRNKKLSLSRKARRLAATDPLAAVDDSNKEDSAPSPEVSNHSENQANRDDNQQGKKTTDETDGDWGVPDSQQLSRGQRKRMAKRENFLRKERLILSSLRLKQDQEQKQRIDGLDAIKEALMNTTSTTSKDDAALIVPHQPTVVKSNKAKQRLVAEEVEHLSLVLQHPAYKADPFATMQEHLRNTLAKERQQQEAASKQRSRQEQKDRQEKARLKKEEGLNKKKTKKKYKPRRTN